MIDKNTVDRIFLTADIVEVIGDFVTLQKKGTNYQACCPFHGEKTPSFVVSPAKGIYKCFGCGKGGNAISFVMEHENMNYGDALKYVAKKYGIEIAEKEQSAEQKAESTDRENMMQVTAYADSYFRDKLINSNEGRNVGLSYFRERGFNDPTIEKFQLGYCPAEGDLFSRNALEKGYREQYLVNTGLTIKRESGGYWDRFAGRVIFPILSISGRVIGFGGRILTSDKKKAKYLNSPESDIYHKSNTLYGIFQAKRAISAQNKCILVEGYTDVISMHQSGIENVVASSGTSLTVEQVILIRRFTHNVTIIYDGDAAGIKASLRGINMVLKEGLNVRIVPLPDGEDPDSFARSHSATETYQYINDHEEDFISFKTKLLLNDAKNDPIAKAAVIHDIVDSISVIGDEIVRAQYIKECSRLLDADEAMLSREVVRHIVSAKGGKDALEVYNNQLHKAQIVEARARPSKKLAKDRNSLYEMEKELISYLLKHGKENFQFVQPRQEPVELNIAEVIIEEMQVDDLTFMEPIYNAIFKDYVQLFAQDNEVSINHFINHPEAAVCDFVVDILTRDDLYRPSKIWAKHTKIAVENLKLSEAIPKCIALYKLKRLEYLISLRKEELRAAPDDFADILKDINALNESRNAVCMKYERIL